MKNKNINRIINVSISDNAKDKLNINNTVRKLSPESIRKRTETRRRLYLEGKLVGGMKGKHQSEEAKNLIAEAVRNRVIKDSTREKLRLVNLGTHPTKETLKKLSESHRGHIHSEEHKAKIRASTPKGSDSHMWKGGISPLCEWIRKSLLYKQWKNSCMIRDDWTCATCRKHGGDMQVHHIKSFADILEQNNIQTKEQARLCKELWNLDNGITLCIGCHGLTHKYFKEVEEQNKTNNQPLFNFIFNNQSNERRESN